MKYDVIVTYADPDSVFMSGRVAAALDKLSDGKFRLLSFQGIHAWNFALVSETYAETLSEDDEEELCAFLEKITQIPHRSGDTYTRSNAVIHVLSYDMTEAG